MIEILIVLVLVLGAAFLAGRTIHRALTGKASVCGCPGARTAAGCRPGACPVQEAPKTARDDGGAAACACGERKHG